jgi:hypothetical protein
MREDNPYWDLVIVYDGQDYPLNLNTLTKREEIAVARKTGLARPEFMEAFFRDDPEATLAGAWLALRRAKGDDAPDLDDIDLPAYGEWLRLADPEGAVAWSAAKAAEAEVDPTPPAETPETT